MTQQNEMNPDMKELESDEPVLKIAQKIVRNAPPTWTMHRLGAALLQYAERERELESRTITPEALNAIYKAIELQADQLKATAEREQRLRDALLRLIEIEDEEVDWSDEAAVDPFNARHEAAIAAARAALAEGGEKHG